MSATEASITVPASARSAERPEPAAGRVFATRSMSLAPRSVVLGGGFGDVASSRWRILRAGAGKQFDPRIAEAALAIPAARWAALLGVPA